MRDKTSGNKIGENHRKEMGRRDWTENTINPPGMVWEQERYRLVLHFVKTL